MSQLGNMLPPGTTGHHANLLWQAVNHNVHIRACKAPERGLGLFASQRLSKGLKILSEEPMLVAEARQALIDDINHAFASMSPDAKAVFTRFYAGRFDMVPLMTIEHVREQESTAMARLQLITQMNGLDGAGIGYILSPSLAAANHVCVPNAFAYYNHETGLVALHALKDIQPGEEITISYLQDNVYLTAGERAQRLAN
ncbi:hypothetical protein PG990_006760 [Apiospora arundinis]|uniref:SET domain-containing protein n=1 Tax=Apiospora arundinis TaxID=335852 RepID=A0ABR2JBT0_9PEZI